MHDKDELVSIITPLYNSERYIDETIESVLNQTYTNWEMIIVDDASSDEGLSRAKYYKDPRIRVYTLERNSGGSAARNYAIDKAKGRYIALLDSDDLWRRNKLEKQIGFMKKEEVELSYTWYTKIDEKGKRRGKVRSILSNIDYENLLGANYIGCLTGIYDTKNIGKVYLPVIKRRQDYALWLKVIKKTSRAVCLEEDLALYRVRSNSLSKSRIKRIYYNYLVYYNVERLGVVRSSYYLLTNMWIKSLANLKEKELRVPLKQTRRLIIKNYIKKWG